MSVRLGLGRLGMPRDRIDASDMGASLWSDRRARQADADGAGAHAGRRERGCGGGDRRTMHSKSTTVRAARPRAADFGLQMELMAAMVSDPGLRTQEWAGLMTRSDRADETFELTAERGDGATTCRGCCIPATCAGPTTPRRCAIRGRPEDAAAYIRPIILNSPIEVIVVGDITVATRDRGGGAHARRPAAARYGRRAAWPSRREVPRDGRRSRSC